MRYVAQLAEGMSTQLQVFQHHLHHFHSCILHQAEVEKSLRQRLHEVLIDAVDMCVPLFAWRLCVDGYILTLRA